MTIATYLGLRSALERRIAGVGMLEPLDVVLPNLLNGGWPDGVLIAGMNSADYDEPLMFRCLRVEDLAAVLERASLEQRELTAYAFYGDAPAHVVLPPVELRHVEPALLGLRAFCAQHQELLGELDDLYWAMMQDGLLSRRTNLIGLPSGTQMRVHLPDLFGKVVRFDAHPNLDDGAYLAMRKMTGGEWPPVIN